jgi:hypothetical protein
MSAIALWLQSTRPVGRVAELGLGVATRIVQLPVPAEFRDVCVSIAADKRTIDAWRAIESDDMFQSKHFCGGFDTTDDAFCFSYYAADGSEYWFQLILSEVASVASGAFQLLSLRLASDFTSSTSDSE